jgi:glycosyltransferase involved in cell wall biosynthesis
MVSHNRDNFIGLAIDSVLSQSFFDWEMIIIDDCSTDNTGALVGKYGDPRIKYFKNESRMGIVQSRNKALSIARGEYVAILDSDDIWQDKDKLKKQVEFLQNNHDYVLCGGMAEIIDGSGKKVGEINFKEKDDEIRKIMLLSNQLVHSSVLYRKDPAVAVGGYGNYEVGEDYDLFLKLGLVGKFKNLSDHLVFYRRHTGGVTWHDRRKSALCHLKIIIQYRNRYPNYLFAVLKAYVRVIISW